ncbi:hypothetical protein [Qipengyuania sp. ASV99]|uniref:hypothetical protein n=1 Tax=Qipengyuania sp. ASV99 TaxID=3399681 RepID=UPI003A4C6F60
MNAPTTPLAAELAALLQWWQTAGVDADFADAATDWLREPESADAPPLDTGRGPPPSSAPQTKPDGGQGIAVTRTNLLGDSPPPDLASFQQWWLSAPELDAANPAVRVPPRGPAGARLMVLVIEPEQGDTQRLLGGPQGRLLARMLAAMGLAQDETYIASALPRHMPMADTLALAASGMDNVTLHHIGLASPQKLLVLGGGVLPLIGQDVSDPDTYLREINQKSPRVPLLVSEGLESLMAMPRLKARFWRRWIEWSAE